MHAPGESPDSPLLRQVERLKAVTADLVAVRDAARSPAPHPLPLDLTAERELYLATLRRFAAHCVRERASTNLTLVKLMELAMANGGPNART